MNVMVAYSIACLAMGVLAGNLARRHQLLILALATVVTVLYFLYPDRLL